MKISLNNLRVLGMHKAKYVNTQPAKNLREMWYIDKFNLPSYWCSVGETNKAGFTCFIGTSKHI